MIDATYLTYEDHVKLQTQVYSYRDNVFNKDTDFKFNTRVRHIYVKASETQNSIWLIPTSTHPPETWDTELLCWTYEGSEKIIQSRKDHIPKHIYLHFNKTTFVELGYSFFPFNNSSPNCKLVHKSKIPRKDPPTILREKVQSVTPDDDDCHRKVVRSRKPPVAFLNDTAV